MNKATIFQEKTVCPRCGRTFVCGMVAGHGKCWCAELPQSPPPAPDVHGCLCPDCLEKLVAAPADQPR